MKNVINWFEIPVVDVERAVKFYGTIFETDLTAAEMDGMTMAVFPYQDGVGGALVRSDMHKPATEGAVLYLNAGEDLNVVLNKVGPAGGQVVMPKTEIGKNGFIAFFTDTEGNQVGLHSMN
ncbi:MAG: VOC family protein [Anaerolineales bacterium]|nr:VOC family protein [Anaerolineales bacterium]